MEAILLVRIISYFAITPAISAREAYIYCAVFGLLIVFRVVFLFHPFHHGGFVTGMQIRVATSALVFRKVCRVLSKEIHKLFAHFNFNEALKRNSKSIE